MKRIISLIFCSCIFLSANCQIFEDHFTKIWDSNIDINYGEHVSGMKFVDSTHGIIITTTVDSMIILNEYLTFDGGYSWTKRSHEVVNGAFSNVLVNGSNYCYAYTSINDTNGVFGIAVNYREIDVASGSIVEKTVPIPLAWYISKVDLSIVDGNKKYLHISNYFTGNGVLDGLYFTNDNFGTAQFISNIDPSNIETYNGVSYFFLENNIYTINDVDIQFYKEEYIHCAANEEVEILKFDDGLYTYFHLACPDEIGIQGSYTGGLHDFLNSAQNNIYLSKFSYKPCVLNNTLFAGSSRIMKYNLHEDTCLIMNEIARSGFGDLNFVYGYSYCQFVSDSIGFVFSSIENEDSTWCLFKTTTGQPATKIPVSNGMAEISEIGIFDQRAMAHPNPFGEELYITSDFFKNETVFSIKDISGKTVHQGYLQSGETKKINLQNLSPGVYYLRIMDEKGQILQNEKIVKQ